MNLSEIASNIKLLAFDVDGVMTDGSITYDENGVEYKTFNAKDGHGLAKMAKNGFITAIITGRKNGTVDRRATDLRVTEVFQGVKNKLPILEAIMEKYGLDFSQVAYMGDDEPDICILEKVAIAACPFDALIRFNQFVISKQTDVAVEVQFVNCAILFLIHNKKQTNK